MTEKELMAIGIEEGKKMLGESLVELYKDHCGCTYGFEEDGSYQFILQMDTRELEYKMGNETPYEYAAFVTINPLTKEVFRDYDNSRLPK